MKYFKNFLFFSFLLFFFLLLTSCNNNTQQNNKKIRIAGSTTLSSITNVWKELFEEENPNIEIEYEGIGSNIGIKLLLDNKIDIASISRELTKEEKKYTNNIEVGRDALAIVVNKQNSINNLSLNDLKNIFSGKIKNWKELGGENKVIQLVNLRKEAGSYTYIKDKIMCLDNKCEEISSNAIILTANSDVKRSVEIIPGAIAYVSYGFLDDRIKILSIDSIPLNKHNIENSKYPLVRNLYYVKLKENSSESVDKFFKAVLSEKYQKLLLREGFIPSSETLL